MILGGGWHGDTLKPRGRRVRIGWWAGSEAFCNLIGDALLQDRWSSGAGHDR